MTTKEIHDLFSSIYHFPIESIDKIAPILEIVTYNKMENFIPFKTTNNYEYMIVNGVCRSYILNYEGIEATLSFYTSGNVLPPNQSRTVNGKSIYNIQCLTPVKVLQFSSEEFAKIMHKNPEIEKWGKKVHNIELKNKVDKELELITLPAKERLIKFRTKFPKLENIIPHSYIASYLGISPVSLSRIRGKK